MPEKNNPGLIVADYIPIYRKPQLEGYAEQMLEERSKMPKSIEPEKCPECGHTEWHVYYTSPGSFRCKKCQCHWQEEDGIPINGKVQARLKILSHGNTKKEYWDEVERLTPKRRCTKCTSPEYFAITNSHDRKVKFVCKECKTVWTEGE